MHVIATITKRKTRGIKISVQDARATGQEFVAAWVPRPSVNTGHFRVPSAAGCCGVFLAATVLRWGFATMALRFKSLPRYRGLLVISFAVLGSAMGTLRAWRGSVTTDRANLFHQGGDTLTNRRVELLPALRRQRTCAGKPLRRDYKNVHTDVQALAHIGLVETDEDRRFYVPWDRISTEINLAA